MFRTGCQQGLFVRPELEPLEDRITPASLPGGFVESQVITGFSQPTAMHQASDGTVFVAQQGGDLRVVVNGALQATPFVSLAVDSSGERGLLGVTTDANFATNRFVYVYYTVPGSGPTPAHNRVSRFTADGTVASGGETVLLDLDNLGTPTNHNGGAIHFGPDGFLYLATGDAGNAANSQSLATTHGKLLRVNADGTIPSGNPFFAQTTGNNRAIWALGLRNPFTFAIDADSGRLFINDVGAASFEEINQGQAGGNYGWPNFEGFGGGPTFLDPLLAYGHGPGTTTGFAIAGAAFYNPASGAFPQSAFAGDYFYADFVNGWVRHYDLASHTSDLFATNFSNPVDLFVSDAGSLFVLTRGDGALTQIDFVNNLTANQKFVQTLYNDFLGRAGTLEEVNGWVNLLGTIGTAGVVQGIARSPEALNQIVDGAYVAVLGRPADPQGRADWANFLRTNTLESLIAGFVGSPEFANRANALFGGPNSDANFVRALYRVLLGREAAGEEVTGWVGVLAGGTSRTSAGMGFVTSPEFRIGAVRTFFGDPTQGPPYQPFFANLLRRPAPPAPSEIDAWVGFGGDLLTMQLGIAASPESFIHRTA